jgi:hypothetical protein
MNSWLQEKINSNKTYFLNLNEYIKSKFLSHTLTSLDIELYDYIWDLLENINEDHNKLISLPNFPLIIPKKFKIIETPEESDTTLDLLIKLDKSLVKIQKILNHNDFFRWFKNSKIIFNYINPWLSLINTIIYLESEKPDINDFEIPFWDKMLNLFNNNDVIRTCDIADNYLNVLYTSYKKSKRIFKHEIILYDVIEIFNTSEDFLAEVFKQIENLFTQSTIASIEEREIISNIKSGKIIESKNKKYLDAKTNLIKKGIIKEIEAQIFGVI